MGVIDIFIIIGPVLVVFSGLFIYMFSSLKSDFNSLKNDFNSLKSDFNSLKGDFNSLKSDFKNDIRSVEKHLSDLFEARLEAKIKPIEIALNNHITGTDKKIDALDKKVELILEKLEAKQ